MKIELELPDWAVTEYRNLKEELRKIDLKIQAYYNRKGS